MMPIVDIFADIVANVRADYDPTNNEIPYYMHGHPLEIATIISEKDASNTHKFKKYPVICLYQDFDENWAGSSVECRNLNIAIITETKVEYEASERYQDTFKNELYPIFDLLKKHIERSKYLNMYVGDITFTKTDRLFWGRNEQSVINDFIDAIEISKLNLIFSNQCQI